MSSPNAEPSPSNSRGGIYAALRYTGIPQTWIRRPKLPSRNWLIFLTVTSSILGYYTYDRRKCRQIREAYIKRVEHFAQEPIGALELPRKVTVYTCKWPGDEDYNRGLKYFRKYVKPVLVAAAIDYDVVNGKRHGDLARTIAGRTQKKRRLDAGLDEPQTSLVVLPAKLSPEQEQERALQGGSVIIGRTAFKEYMEGLKRGWTQSLRRVDREEALAHELGNDGRFDEPDEADPSAGLDGEPIPTPSRLASSNAAQLYSPLKLSSSNPQAPVTKEQSTWEDDIPPPEVIPPQPPLLLVPFTNHIGFKQIPIMIVDFFNQRAKVQSGAETALRLVMGHHRAFTPPSDSEPGDLGFDRKAESYYPSSVKNFIEDIDKAREDYYKALSAKLETARALTRFTREPTKDERNHPPPTEVELRAERLKKELRWRSDAEGWGIIRPNSDVAWDDRFREALEVFVDPPDEQIREDSQPH